MPLLWLLPLLVYKLYKWSSCYELIKPSKIYKLLQTNVCFKFKHMLEDASFRKFCVGFFHAWRKTLNFRHPEAILKIKIMQYVSITSSKKNSKNLVHSWTSIIFFNCFLSFFYVCTILNLFLFIILFLLRVTLRHEMVDANNKRTKKW